MRRSVLVPLAAALVALTLAAAPADAQRRRDDRGAFARQGDAALTFSIDNFVLRPFEGGVGGRLWVTDRTVAAASLGFGYTALDDGGDAFSASFAVGGERHLGRSRRVSPFVGLGVRVGYGEQTTERYVYDYPAPAPCLPDEPCPVPDPIPYPYEATRSLASVGGAAFLGAEVRLLDGVTLAAAHRLGITYTRVRDEYPPFYYPTYPCETCEPVPDDRPGTLSILPYTRSVVEFGTGVSSLTLSIYL